MTLLAKDIVSQIAILAKDEELEKKTFEINEQYKELDEFTYIVSHDLKSPLNAIKHLAFWIEEDMENGVTKDMSKYFSMIKNSTERIDRLFKGLSCYSKAGRDEAPAERIELKAIVSECCESLDITNNFDFQVDECEIELPKVSLFLVLQHLICNAVKHHHKKYGVIRIGCIANSDGYQLSISDDGPGIAAEFHNKIFLPFKALKSKDEMESNGLGLAMIKKALSRYGGNITVKSNVGTGTEFIVTWPKNAAIKLV
jgi:light-regulated signal transduction histidine kinase (bacteriophytochrome)